MSTERRASLRRRPPYELHSLEWESGESSVPLACDGAVRARGKVGCKGWQEWRGSLTRLGASTSKARAGVSSGASFSQAISFGMHIMCIERYRCSLNAPVWPSSSVNQSVVKLGKSSVPWPTPVA